jgi:uncharacterized membrane protein AbrB (regulator of aidB expression)
MTAIAFLFSTIISAGSLAWGFAGSGFRGVSTWIALFGLFWLFSHWRGWKWFSPFGLFLAILFAVLGLWLDFPIGWMFSGALFALFAWDMTEFGRKLGQLPAREDAKGIERRHLLRVSLLVLGGLLTASLFMLYLGQFDRAWGMFLAGVVAVGSTQVFAWIKR